MPPRLETIGTRTDQMQQGHRLATKNIEYLVRGVVECAEVMSESPHGYAKVLLQSIENGLRILEKLRQDTHTIPAQSLEDIRHQTVRTVDSLLTLKASTIELVAAIKNEDMGSLDSIKLLSGNQEGIVNVLERLRLELGSILDISLPSSRSMPGFLDRIISKCIPRSRHDNDTIEEIQEVLPLSSSTLEIVLHQIDHPIWFKVLREPTRINEHKKDLDALDLRYIYANPAAHEYFGVEDALGKDDAQVNNFSRIDEIAILETEYKVLSTGEIFEQVWPHKDRVFLVRKGLWRESDRIGTWGVAIDISELYKAQHEILEKNEVIGELRRKLESSEEDHVELSQEFDQLYNLVKETALKAFMLAFDKEIRAASEVISSTQNLAAKILNKMDAIPADSKSPELQSLEKLLQDFIEKDLKNLNDLIINISVPPSKQPNPNLKRV